VGVHVVKSVNFETTCSTERCENTYRKKEWLKNEYITKNRFIKDIAKDCKTSMETIQRWATKFNLSKNQKNHLNDYKDKKWLYNQYITLKKTKKEIGEQQGVSVGTIDSWRIKFKISKM